MCSGVIASVVWIVSTHAANSMNEMLFVYVSSPKEVNYELARASHIVGAPIWICVSQTNI